MVETSNHQPFQLHPATGSPPQGPVVNIEVCTDSSTGEKFIFWEDIETFFPGLQSVRRDSDIMVTFMRDNQGQRVQFRRAGINMPEVAPNYPHVFGHEGYELKRFDEFSKQYGSYAVNILESIKYGFPLHDQVIPSIKDIEPPRIFREGRDGVEYQRTTCGDIAIGIEEAIKSLRPSRTSSRRAFDKRVEAGALRTMATMDLSGLRRFLKGVDASESIHPDDSRGLGCLMKGTTSTGRATWLCYAHHQAIYDTEALVRVKRATTGDFQYSNGVLKLSTSKAKYAESPVRLFEALMRTSLLTELDILLDLDMTYKELKLLKDAIFSMKRLRRLRLDFVNYGGPTTDIFNRGKRGDVLAEILTSCTLQAVFFCRVEWFFTRLSTFETLEKINISELHLEADFKPKVHSHKLQALLHKCSRLEILELWCSDTHFCDTVDLVRKAVQGHATFVSFHLNSRHFKVTFDRADFDAQVDPLSSPMVAISSAYLPGMKVLRRFGPLIHTFAIDARTTNEEIVYLRDVVERRKGSKLRRIDIVMPSSCSQYFHIEQLLSVVHTLNKIATTRSLKDTSSSKKQLDRVNDASIKSHVACSITLKFYESLTDGWAQFIGAVFPYIFSLELDILNLTTPCSFGIGHDHSILETFTFRGTALALDGLMAKELLQIISQSPFLNSLSLRYTHLKTEDWEAVLDTLDYTRLRDLNLDSSNFGEAHATRLVGLFEESSALSYIRILSTPMGREARLAFKKGVEEKLPNCKVQIFT
ncbi:hypothetical protein EC991_001260 [Linnemannia zychae]|nr:hypothetical protein EC991_001260 [Linnemannia zychae]